jgi:hypothetical protein
MSSALAIAAVSAVLKNLLDNALISQAISASIGDVTITALPPDRIAAGSDERAQLNLYLYRLSPNSARRRVHTSVTPGEQHTGVALALDLHYLLTAYGERDFQAEMLLGYAAQCLQATPVLSREIISAALASFEAGNASSGTQAALASSNLAQQVEDIKITPEFLSLEDTSKLWSSLQARARLSITYLVSVVLIEEHLMALSTPTLKAGVS